MKPARIARALLLLVVLAQAARAEEIGPRELATRLERARRATHRALELVDADVDEDPIEPLRKSVASLDGARVRSGHNVIDVDPRAGDEVEKIAEESSTNERRDRLARLERRFAALEREARRAEKKVRTAGAPVPAEGTNQLQAPEAPPKNEAREALSKVLEQPRYKKRTELEGFDLSGKLESFEQRLINWWMRLMQPRAFKWPAWLSAIGRFLAGLLPTTILGWLALVLAVVLLIAAFVYVRWRRKRDRRPEEPATLGDVASATRAAVVPEESFSEEHWRREARLLAQQGNFRGAVRALYTGVLIHLQRAGRLKFDRGKTNWEHVRELRRNDRGLAARLEPLTRTFDAAWYGQKPVEAPTFDAFLAEADGFVAAAGSGLEAAP